ncbi:MAG: D-sedoheptulose 7-phosphate isomerase [Nanoarchaeota archaeon]
MKDTITQCINDSIETKKAVRDQLASEIEKSARIMIDALNSGNKILICGNGGSAADAQHFAAELMVRFEKERDALPAVALHCDSSNVTACGNDYGYDKVFERAVSGLGQARDVLVAISTSGNSPNVMLAVDKAKSIGMKVIGLLGKDGGKMNGQGLDSALIVPSKTTARIQESHITIIHIWCKLIDEHVNQ